MTVRSPNCDGDTGEWKDVKCVGKETSGNTVERVQDFTAGGETRSQGNARGPGQIREGYKIYAETFKNQSHLNVIISEAQEIVGNALGQS